MPVLTTDQIVGKAESVADTIYKIRPRDTPFVSSLEKTTIKAVLHQWQEKTLGEPTLNAQAEGAEATDGTGIQPVLRSNNTQILTETVKVSATSDVVSKYGRASEIAELIVDAGQNLMNALEFSCVNTKQVATQVSPRVFAGVQAQIDPLMIIKTGGASTPLSSANVDAAMLALYRSGGRPTTLMVTPEDAANVAAWTGAAGRYRNIEGTGKTYTNVIEIYQSPNGQIAVKQNRYMAATDALVYGPDHWNLLVLRPWAKKPLAVSGDYNRFQITGEYSLMHENYKASALIRRAA